VTYFDYHIVISNKLFATEMKETRLNYRHLNTRHTVK